MYKKQPGEPVIVVAHSNGTMATLLALQQIEIDEVILLASPLNTKDGKNIELVKELLEGKNLKNGLYNVFSQHDLVTMTVGGARPWPIDPKTPKFKNSDWSEFAQGKSISILKLHFEAIYGPFGVLKWPKPTVDVDRVMIPTIRAHSIFADPMEREAVKIYAETAAWRKPE